MAAAESAHKRICDAVAAAIVALGLTDYPNAHVIDDEHVLVRWGIETEPKGFPCVFVSPVGTVSVTGGTNERDDWSRPVTIYIADRISLAQHGAMDAVLLWPERISKRFIQQRLAVEGLTHCWGQFNPSPVLDTAIVQAFSLLVEPIFFNFISREARG